MKFRALSLLGCAALVWPAFGQVTNPETRTPQYELWLQFNLNSNQNIGYLSDLFAISELPFATIIQGNPQGATSNRRGRLAVVRPWDGEPQLANETGLVGTPPYAIGDLHLLGTPQTLQLNNPFIREWTLMVQSGFQENGFCVESVNIDYDGWQVLSK